MMLNFLRIAIPALLLLFQPARAVQTIPFGFFRDQTPAPCTGTQVRIYLTTGSSWSVPSNWCSSNNSIEVIGGGGSGWSAGGGGGAYAKQTNVALTPGATVSYAVGAGGAGASSPPYNGSDTFFCNSTVNCSQITGSAVVVGAKAGGGADGSGPGAGGTAAASVGSVKYSGGTGGGFTNGSGGGAGGPNGAGANGAASMAAGGTAGGGLGGVGGTANGGVGGSGTEWDATHGSGGGGGGNNNCCHPNGGLYGGGGGGAASISNIGPGAQGIIVITYRP